MSERLVGLAHEKNVAWWNLRPGCVHAQIGRKLENRELPYDGYVLTIKMKNGKFDEIRGKDLDSMIDTLLAQLNRPTLKTKTNDKDKVVTEPDKKKKKELVDV